MTPEVGRPRRERPVLLREAAIVAAARVLIRRDGVEAVTMRRVGEELGTGAASLYAYLSGRDELLAAVLESVLQEIPRPVPDPAAWRRQAQAVVEGVRSALRAHAGLAVVAARPASDEASFELLESLLAILEAGQITGARAAAGADGLYGLAVAGALDAVPGEAVEEDLDATGPSFQAPLPDRFPHLARLQEELAPERRAARFATAVGLLLDGLAAEAS
jgi:AcrR family transcriptional regulator